jgi:hypothetical protein
MCSKIHYRLQSSRELEVRNDHISHFSLSQDIRQKYKLYLCTLWWLCYTTLQDVGQILPLPVWCSTPPLPTLPTPNSLLFPHSGLCTPYSLCLDMASPNSSLFCFGFCLFAVLGSTLPLCYTAALINLFYFIFCCLYSLLAYFIYLFVCLLLQYWGLNSGPTTWAIPSALIYFYFVKSFFSR